MVGENALVRELQELAGDSLRVVATYDRKGYDVRYAREDVESRLGNIAEDVHQDLVLEGLSRVHLEELFDAGDLRCSMHRFEEVTAFHFPEAEYQGLFVSIDSQADVPLASFTDTCWSSL
jgi:hypothetical protein